MFANELDLACVSANAVVNFVGACYYTTYYYNVGNISLLTSSGLCSTLLGHMHRKIEEKLTLLITTFKTVYVSEPLLYKRAQDKSKNAFYMFLSTSVRLFLYFTSAYFAQ